MSDTNEMMHKEYAFALRGSGDRDIGHSDHEIEMDSLDGSKDMKIGNIMPQVGRYVLRDGHSGIVVTSGRPLRVDTIILDHKTKTTNNAIDGIIGYIGTEIGRTGLANSDDIEVGGIKPHVRRFILPVGPDEIVLVTHLFFFLTDFSSLQHSSVAGLGTSQ